MEFRMMLIITLYAEQKRKKKKKTQIGSFNFLRNLHIVFHSGCPNLHSYQQCGRPPFFPHPHQHLLLLGFSIITILTGMKLYLNVFLISISLIIDVEHLLMYLLAMCMSLKKCIFKSAYLKQIFFFCCGIISVLYLFWILNPIGYMMCNSFLI